MSHGGSQTKTRDDNAKKRKGDAMKSRILTLILAGVMSISLLACGGTAKTPDSSGSAQGADASAVSITEASASDVESTETGKTPSAAQVHMATFHGR